MHIMISNNMLCELKLVDGSSAAMINSTDKPNGYQNIANGSFKSNVTEAPSLELGHLADMR
jgi:hypothetical protein